eukprot:CAMPEP_0183423348 /NCGR_PEP_ID=MMETSP0370-20130417/28417_1 /TAXON_ID=268820 /ORGANISM="Peridinium aciculiferum, Strain PAER-2" /LENGTH=47 /DNA_ID= /DNA_START= /DNA_END= /DNA_ORIENTATION=
MPSKTGYRTMSSGAIPMTSEVLPMALCDAGRSAAAPSLSQEAANGAR